MSANARAVLNELVSLQENNVREAINKTPDLEAQFLQRLEEYKGIAKWISDSIRDDVSLNDSQKNLISHAMTDLMLFSSEKGSGTKTMKIMNLVRFINEFH